MLLFFVMEQLTKVEILLPSLMIGSAAALIIKRQTEFIYQEIDALSTGPLIRLRVRSFARTTHLFPFSTLHTAVLIRLLTYSRARGKEVFLWNKRVDFIEFEPSGQWFKGMKIITKNQRKRIHSAI